MSSKTKSHKNKSYSLKYILRSYLEIAQQSLKTLPANGYRSRSQLLNECPKQIANILEKMQIGIEIFELIITHFQSECPLQAINKKIRSIQSTLNDGSKQLFNKIVIPYVYNQAQGENEKIPIFKTYLSGLFQDLNYNNYLMGNQQYPLILDDQIENQGEKDLKNSQKQYEFLFNRKVLQLHFPKSTKQIKRKGPQMIVHFEDFQLYFELRPCTYQRDQQRDLLLLYQQVKIEKCLQTHEQRINEIMRQKLNFMLSQQTEKYFILYLEYLYRRIGYGYFYLERINQYIQQNKQYFVDVKYQFNNMNLRFYYVKQYEHMNEIMGENGQFQASLSINKLSFDQFIKFQEKKIKQSKFKTSNLPAKSLTQANNCSSNDQNVDENNNSEDILQINIFGSRFNSLDKHEIRIPDIYKLNEDINVIMKYIQHSVYSLSKSNTAFANFNLNLFSKSYYQLIEKYPQICIKKQGKADFIIFPQYFVKVKKFKKDCQKFYEFNEKNIRDNHNQEAESQVELESQMQIQESEQEDNIEENIFFLGFIAQFYIYQAHISTIYIRNIKGQKIHEICSFTKKHLSKYYQNLICVKMIIYIILKSLNNHQYSMTNSVDLKYYFASKHVFVNNQSGQVQTIKTNMDYSDPQHISMLFIIIIEDQKLNEKIIEEFQFQDLVKRFSYTEEATEEDKKFLQNTHLHSRSHYENSLKDNNISYEKLEHIFENFIHFAKQLISSETYLYKDALAKTFKCDYQQLQIQANIGQ
ncbi:hypothetical protein TTHERM_00039000 (macronuclear) [Tetrahymena thermophila SB210]|uniref:Uncharacterized protein n=1 Tax=Tetrahymena thermophila (strain SB210) TaxID=312017 RepID=Q22M19_TETTS|nr:hypothetical protein TTHERM_00039000 [Tetrahymena thermophila SB210]EAR86605.2 hypothetical protein TTHERM_00039000 [Tetrahymena thermophila SB210]|eukprot:XP_977201.2 hypothetical protein TTHERM_00039000 [Tetrahymena thermophila SB210]